MRKCRGDSEERRQEEGAKPKPKVHCSILSLKPLSPQELRAGLNYRLGGDATSTNVSLQTPNPDIVNFHGQITFTWKGYSALARSERFELPTLRFEV
jgi:hypothetical protein